MNRSVQRRVMIATVVAVIAAVVPAVAVVQSALSPAPASAAMLSATGVAGNGSTAGYVDGTGSAARFNNPQGVVLSADESILYVADTGNKAIRAVNVSSGVVTTLATLSLAPQHIALGVDGALYVTAGSTPPSITSVSVPNGPDKVLKVTAGGAVSDVASGFYAPSGIGFTADGSLWVIDGDWTCATPAGCAGDGGAAIVRLNKIVGGSRLLARRFDYWAWFSRSGALAAIHNTLILSLTGHAPSTVLVYDPASATWYEGGTGWPGAPSDLAINPDGTALMKQEGNDIGQWAMDMSVPQMQRRVNAGGDFWFGATAVAINQKGTRSYESVGPGGFITYIDYPPVPRGFGASESRGGSNPSEWCWRCLIDRPVTPDNGAVVESQTDLSVTARGRGLTLSRTYDSQYSSQDSPLGFGWALSDSVSASYNSSAPSWTVFQENGSTVTFTADGVGGWSAPPRVLGTLTETTSTVAFARKGTETFTFDKPSGHLSSRVDARGNTYAYTYASGGSGPLASVTEASSGRTLAYTWDVAGTHVTSVSDDLGRKVSYGYDASGNLHQITDVRGSVTTYDYDSNHRITQITDGRSNVVVANTFNPDGTIATQKDGIGVISGRATTYSYATATGGLHTTTVTSPEGRVTLYAFDRYGELVSRTQGYATSAAVTTTFGYDPICVATTRQAVTSTADPTVATQTWSYDHTTCNLTAQTDTVGKSITFANYNAWRKPQSVTDRNGHPTTLSYDSYGNPTGSSAPIDAATSQILASQFSPTNHTDLTKTTDGQGKDWLRSYTSAGDLASTSAPSTAAGSAKTVFTYDLVGRPTTAVSPRGNTTPTPDNSYRSGVALNTANQPIVHVDANSSPVLDTFGRANSTSGLGTSDSSQSWSTIGSSVWGIDKGSAYLVSGSGGLAYTAGAADGQISFAIHGGFSQGVTFRGDGTADNYWEFVPVSAFGTWALVKVVGATVTMTGLTGFGTTCCTNDQLVTVTFRGPTINAYLGGVKMLSVTDSALASNTKVGMRADTTGPGRLSPFVFATASGGVTTTGYDTDGNVAWSNDALANHTSYVYDANNRLTQTHRADGTVLTSSYTDDGLLYQQIDANNKATTYHYDPARRLDWTRDPLGRQTSYAYTAVGSLKTSTDADNRVTTYSYDAAGRKASIHYNSTVTPDVTSISYDNNNNRTAMTDGSGTWTYTYDWLNRLTSSSLNNGSTTRTTTTTYDLNNHVKTTLYPNVATPVTRYYDDAGNQMGLTDWLSPTQNTFSYDLDSNLVAQVARNGVTSTYSYDHAGRTTAITHANTAATLAAWSYSRDAAAQLTTTASTGVGGSESYTYTALNQLVASLGTYTHTYDSADNLTRLANGTTQHFDAANQLTTQNDTSGAVTASFTYDNEGNRTSRAIAGLTTTYSYDQANRYLGVPYTLNTYNGDGLRTRLTFLGVPLDYTYDLTGGLGQIIALSIGGTDTNYIYGPGGAPLEQVTGTTATWLGHDQLGSTRLLTDANATKTGDYTYTPYGQVASHTGTASTNLQYAGQWAEGDFIYLRARFYDPATAQFITRDPMTAMTRSAYGYVHGNPLNGVDPSGLDSYNYTFDLGRLGTPEQLAAYANGRCSDLFPIDGCKSNFQVGDEMPLEDHILFWSQSFPVKVINMTSTSWTFVAMDGHPEGPGRTITFSFCQDDQGNNKLNISTSDDGSATVNWWGLRNINFFVAETKWQDFADNIRTNFRWSQNDGAGNPSDPGVWV